MNTLLAKPELDFPTEQDAWPDDDVRMQIRGLLAALYPRTHLVERRRGQRYPFPYLVYLTPLADDGVTPEGKAVAVVGKHISERGLGFYHPRPLAYRRVIASMEAGNGNWLSFLVDLTWCRFTRQGWYESGGRLLQAVHSPLEVPQGGRTASG